MKYLIDVGHPAHVHYFRNLANLLIGKGDDVIFTCRDKEMTISLLKHYGFKYFNFGQNYKTKSGKIFGLFYFTFRLFLVALKFRPDVYLNASMYSAIVAWIFRKTHISLEDTFNMEQVRLILPFTSCILTGDYSHPSMGNKEICYSGYQELLYLHPNYFNPDSSIFQELGISLGTPYVILRFVSWNASHDYGHKGISYENKLKAVKEFSKYARVFISSESELPDDLKQYKLNIAPSRIHDALAFASLHWAESFTMPAECSILGTPSIVMHNTKSYYLSEQEEKYGLCYCYSESDKDQKLAIEKGIELLQMPGLKEEWNKRRDKMLADKIDVTAFMVWFIENYPESKRIMKENPEYQFRFK